MPWIASPPPKNRGFSRSRPPHEKSLFSCIFRSSSWFELQVQKWSMGRVGLRGWENCLWGHCWQRWLVHLHRFLKLRKFGQWKIMCSKLNCQVAMMSCALIWVWAQNGTDQVPNIVKWYTCLCYATKNGSQIATKSSNICCSMLFLGS